MTFTQCRFEFKVFMWKCKFCIAQVFYCNALFSRSINSRKPACTIKLPLTHENLELRTITM